jgi:hypothetical protein
MKAWTLVKTRGVRAAHTPLAQGCQETVAGDDAGCGRSSVSALTIAPCWRSVVATARGPAPLDVVHERRVDDVRFGPRRTRSEVPECVGDLPLLTPRARAVACRSRRAGGSLVRTLSQSSASADNPIMSRVSDRALPLTGL